MKNCRRCGVDKPHDQFSKSVQSKDGLYSYCKPCVNEKTKQWYSQKKQDVAYLAAKNAALRARAQENKLKAIEYKGGCCSDCGGVFDPCVYDFHHEDVSTKEKNPSAFLGRSSFENALSELDKCVLLCANCHRLRHFKDYE